MADDAFLKLDDVNGEVQDSQFEKWIEIFCSPGARATPASVPPVAEEEPEGLVPGPAHHEADRQVVGGAVKKCATGAHFQKADLHVRKAGGDATGASSVFLKIELQDVPPSSVQFEGAIQGDDRPSEDVTLNFAKIYYEYDAPDGEVDQYSWDLAQ